MAENKKSFLLYCDYKEIFESISDKNAADLIRHIFRYVNDENPISENESVNLLFITIKNQLKRDLKKYESKVDQWSKAGIASAEAKRLKRSTDSTDVNDRLKRSTDSTVTDTVNVTVTDKDILYKGNFFYIGTEIYKFPVSNYIKNMSDQFLDVWQMQNKTLKIENVLIEMDKNYIGTQFNNEEHIRNSFKFTAKEMLKPKKQFNQPEQNIKATTSYARPK